MRVRGQVAHAPDSLRRVPPGRLGNVFRLMVVLRANARIRIHYMTKFLRLSLLAFALATPVMVAAPADAASTRQERQARTQGAQQGQSAQTQRQRRQTAQTQKRQRQQAAQRQRRARTAQG